MKSISLRALTMSDINKTLSWSNSEEISNLYSGHPFPVNLEMEKLWYDKVLTSNFPTTVFGIESIEDKVLVGITVLKTINMINRNAEFAIYIGDKSYRGKGLAKEATILTVKFAFYDLGLNKVYLKVLEDNKAAVKLYNSTGFVKEGLLEESVFKNNKFHSEIIMAAFKKNFNE